MKITKLQEVVRRRSEMKKSRPKNRVFPAINELQFVNGAHSSLVEEEYKTSIKNTKSGFDEGITYSL